MFLVLGLIVVALIVVFLFVFKPFEEKVEYDKDKYEGIDTKQFEVTSLELREFITNRDDNSLESMPKPDDLCKLLKSDLKTGLTDGIELRQKHFGINSYASPPFPTFLSLFLDSFEDRTLQILLGSAIISMVLGITVAHEDGGWVEGVAILAAVFLVSSITAMNDYNKEKQFRALSSVDADKRIKVIRDGGVRVISTFDLVVGDILSMEAGDMIPADSIYLSGDGVKVDESSLTGESVPNSINSDNAVLLSGCTVKEGMVRSIVVATGMNSVYGQVKALVEKERSNTPLQDKLEELADFIGWLGVGAAVLTFLALLVKWFIYRFVTTDLGWEWGEAKNLVDMVITAITIVAMAVPEGLPLAVTIALAYSMMKMTKDNNLVRHLVACETMGGATQICSDKTGTLTQNKMTVTNANIGNTVYDADKGDKIETFQNNLSKSVYSKFITNITINSSANVLVQNNQKVVSGSASEIALLEFVQNMDVDIEKERWNKLPDVLRSFAFSSNKKRMSTLLSHSNGTTLFVKGASEVVLRECVSEMTEDGKVIPLETSRVDTFLRQIEEWASRGLRTLTLAHREVQLDSNNGKVSEIEDGSLDVNLTLIAIVAIKDPVREEVPRAVIDCQKAGIVVRMLTGDNILTAKDIATQCNILHDSDIALEGPQFRKMTDEQIIKILPKLTVIARCSPEDKLKMVKLLRSQGEVVAVTGDGTNDAPQLNEADVGFAMGIAGTEVAKQASDIILLDDNFSSIKMAVMWGLNICAVFMGLLGAITNGKTPLNAVQLLWVNLIMDTFAALALATDPPTNKLLDSPPYGRSAPLITRKMWICIVGQVVFQLSILIFLLFSDLTLIPFLNVLPGSLSIVRDSMIFNVFVFCQIFNEFNCRKVESEGSIFSGVLENKIFVIIMTFTVVTQVLLIQYGGAFVSTCALNMNQWIFCVGISSLSIVIGSVLRKLSVNEFHPQTIRIGEAHREHQIAAKHLLHEDVVRENGSDVTTVGDHLHGSKSKKKLTKRADQ